MRKDEASELSLEQNVGMRCFDSEEMIDEVVSKTLIQTERPEGFESVERYEKYRTWKQLIQRLRHLLSLHGMMPDVIQSIYPYELDELYEENRKKNKKKDQQEAWQSARTQDRKQRGHGALKPHPLLHRSVYFSGSDPKLSGAASENPDAKQFVMKLSHQQQLALRTKKQFSPFRF